ncbi:serine/threonine-protein kinase [Streptomyces sp. VRA16 Mangrove soil]|uniref:serine/threonine-protein kinase n=1 Tax=Streptomyces sp. VRA16 Mangrove soil TaxID=2817434 RepID=UPI001E57E9B1|nr:serine/threonine-protein kinase [Streptomyces sp. VRA16 Mangrove soil]
MGTVWRAHDDVLGREVAVKEVRAPAGLPPADRERMYRRLEREAWAAARIAHRNVITLYDVATDGERPWVVMELVRGVSLADQLDAEGPLSPQRAAHIGAEVLAALRAAHEAGVLHRDVKPGNVLLSNDGRVVLTDFGIAMVEGTQALTMTGEVIGSPEFLAPERALGRTPGPESDLWSLGVLLYAAVEGHSPFRQDTPLSTLRAVVDEELPPADHAGPLTPVIEGLLRKDPAERISAADAERDLRIVGAGGTLRPGSSGLSSMPTQTGRYPSASSTPPKPLPVPVPLPTAGAASAGSPSAAAGTASTVAADTGRRDARRASLALIAGIVVLLLAIGGLAYALLNRDDGGGGSNSGGSSGGSGSGSSGGGATNAGGGGGGSSTGGGPSESSSAPGGSSTSPGSGGSGGGGGHTTTPAQSVRVSVSAVRGSYSGPCPPPASAAPAFAATITVGRTPAEVEYRWVTKSGEPSDPGWKTLSFGSGGAKSRTVNTTEATYTDGGTLRNEIGVEVRSPVAVTSDFVSYSVTCEVVTPTTGATTGSPTY